MNVMAPEGATGFPRALAGKVAVVTGSTSGIALGTAKALAVAGAAPSSSTASANARI